MGELYLRRIKRILFHSIFSITVIVCNFQKQKQSQLLMPPAKQPKPFLKRGTRQFLSNATVRSLNQKPKIVDFSEQTDQQFQNPSPFAKAQKSPSQQHKIQIKIANKPKVNREPEPKLPSRFKQNKNMNQQISIASTSNKKKQTVLDDYLGSKPKAGRESNSKEKKVVTSKPVLPHQGRISMATQLKRQDQELSDEEEKSIEIVQEKPKPRVNNPIQKLSAKPAVSKIAQNELQSDKQVNFNSDSEEELPKAKPKAGRPQILPKAMQKKSRWEEDEEVEKNTAEQTRGPSKLLQKYYKKQAQPSKPVLPAQKKITSADIPRNIKQQIFIELLAEKQSDFTKKLDQLQNSITRAKKQRQTLEQSRKQLAKDREQFQKQMQAKRKAFEQKISTENQKLTRQKRYMKDHQTSGKVDWKVKAELEELKAKLQTLENQKKKLKADGQRQAERLKKKNEQIQQENQSLKSQIRCIQMQKIETKERPITVYNTKKSQVPVARQIPWSDAPKRSYLFHFLDDSFSISNFDPILYSYESVEYYKYYIEHKDDQQQLINEQKDSNGSKITRKYKNGKIENEYVGKVLRQTFPAPFRFTIVHHLNGDVKMLTPQGVQIYFSKGNQITQWRINPSKTIHYFHNQNQAELKYRHPRLGDIHEVFNGQILKKTQSGFEAQYRKNQNGDLVKIR